MDSVADLRVRRAYAEAIAVDKIKAVMAEQAGPISLRERLAASHGLQSASVSPLAIEAYWRWQAEAARA